LLPLSLGTRLIIVGRMSEITTIFFDVGGVLLSDGWGHDSRRAAAAQFGLDWDDFTDRHEKVAHLIETNRLALERYLDRVIFYRPRSFSRDEFRDFIFAQSQPRPESLEIAQRLAGLKKYFLATLNNEVLELNNYRIERFDLCKYFTVFFSSCYLGLRKPDEAIYRAALNIVQSPPGQCLFVDDREVNLECPRELGVRTIHFQDATQLRRELRENGVDW
jgi:putative hydrolase of the HAD superfamily